MFTSNSRDELELVQAKLNVAEDLMNCAGLSPLEARDFEERLQRMKRDVHSRLEIGRENLNYKLPLYDVMYGHRQDLNTIDDFQEIAVERLCDEILHQPSDYRSLWEVPSVHSWVVFKHKASDVLHNVAIEYLSEHSNQYVIQLMEYPEAYFEKGEGLLTDSMLQLSAKALAESFDLDRLYVFELEELATIQDSTLTYWGAHVLKYSRSSKSLESLLYIEQFNSNRNAAFFQAWMLVLGLLALTMLILLGYWARKSQVGLKAIGKKALHLVGVAGLYALLLGGVIYLGKTYAAVPSAYAIEPLSRLSELLFALLLPAALLVILRIYRTLIHTGLEREVDLFVVYAFALLIIPISLSGFAYFKSFDGLKALSIALMGCSVLPVAALISRTLHRNKLNALSGFNRVLALSVSTVSVFAVILYLQQVPETPLDLVKLSGAPLMSLALWIRQGQTSLTKENAIAVSNIRKGALDPYPELLTDLEDFASSKEATLGQMWYQRGWGKTTIRRDSAVPYLKKKGGLVFESEMKECMEGEAGHVFLARSIRKDSPEAANIIYDPGAAESLHWAQRISQMALSFFADADPTDAFDRLRRFKPESAAAELLDFISSTRARTAYWWIDDFDLLDEEGRAFLIACFTKARDVRLKDGSLPLKVVLSGATEAELDDDQRRKFEALVRAQGVVVRQIGDGSIEKRALLSALLKEDIEGCALSRSTQEKLKDRFDPFVDDVALQFNLNAAKGILSYLISEDALVLSAETSGAYGLEEGTKKNTWIHDERIDEIDFRALISQLSNEEKGGVAFDRQIKRTLELAAAIGMRFDVRILSKALDRPHLELMDDLAEAESSGVIWDDPVRDHVFHFRSEESRRKFLKPSQESGGQMTQRERDAIRITGKIAEQLFEEENSSVHLLSIAAEQAWQLRSIPSHHLEAIKLHDRLLHVLEKETMIREQSEVLSRLCVLEPDSLERLSAMLLHELNASHVLPQPIFRNAKARIMEFDGANEVAATVCSTLLTSAHRSGSAVEIEDLDSSFKRLVPDDSIELKLRARFNDAYWKADLTTNEGRAAALEALKILAGQIDETLNPNLRSLKGEVLNAAAGILIDRMKSPKPSEGLALLEERFHLLPGQHALSLDQEVRRFFHREAVNPATIAVLTPSERKSVAMSMNYALRGYFLQEKVPRGFPERVIQMNHRVSEHQGELLALSFAAWHKIRLKEFDSDLVRFAEGYFQKVTQKTSAGAKEYLNALAIAMMHRAQVSQSTQGVSETIVSSCLNRFQSLFEDPYPSSQRIDFVPPGQTDDLIVLISKALSEIEAHSKSIPGLDDGQLEVLRALDFRGKELRIPPQTKKHLLRHFHDISEQELNALMADLPEESETSLRAQLGLPGSCFLPDGPLASLQALEDAVQKSLDSSNYHLDVLTVLSPGTHRLAFSIQFAEDVGHEGVVRITPELRSAVRNVLRGNREVPMIAQPAPRTATLRFVIHHVAEANTVELITAYTGTYAPPLDEKSFWSDWALIGTAEVNPQPSPPDQ